MTDPDSDSRSAFDRRKFLTLAGATGLAGLAGCGGDTAGDTPSETETGSPTDTDAPTETDTPTATDTPTETATETDTPTETGPDIENGPFAAIPTPAGDDVERPSGDAGNLEVLDWAGFESAVTYSFDDGQPSHVAHYEELEATGVDMTFYVSVNAEPEGARETWKQAIEDGHEIGNHTVSHPHDDRTGSSFGDPEDSLAAEIEGCSEYITDTLGQGDDWTFAAPFGEGGWTEPARESDLFLNRGVGGGAIAPGEGTDPYNLSCYMATEGDTADTFNGKIDSARSNGEWMIFLFHSIRPTDQEWYAPVDVGEITGSVEHAKSYDDVWVDTVANVGAYWRGQQIIESATTEESGDEATWTWTVPEDYPSHQTVRVTVDGGTLSQNGTELDWNSAGYYEVALDEESLTLAP